MRIDLRTSLIDALAVSRGNLVSLVGAGGKTSLMYGLGRELSRGGNPALLTTTTNIRYPSAREATEVVVGEETAATIDMIAGRLRVKNLVVAGRVRLDGKLAGFSPAFLESLRGRDSTWTIVAECDGAKGKSLKVPRDHEPPVAASTDLFVVVVGADSLGRPLDSEEVFEGNLVAAVAGVAPDSLVDREIVVKTVLSPQSYFGRRPQQARFCVFINKVDVESLDRPGPAISRSQVTSAFEVGLALKAESRVERVIYGSLERPSAKGYLVLC